MDGAIEHNNQGGQTQNQDFNSGFVADSVQSPIPKLKVNKPIGKSVVSIGTASDNGAVQTKLTVGSADSSAEKEADSVADQVVEGIKNDSVASLVNRKEEVNRKVLQRKSSDASGGELNSKTQERIENARSGGSALEPGVQQQMENHMGADFSNVRIHTNAESDSLNREMSAKAFTTGSDVFFAGGQYNPGSSEGQHLIAHELTHVVQQNSGIQRASVISGISSNSSNIINRAYMAGYATDTAHLHNIDETDGSDQGRIGDKIKAGDQLEIDTDEQKFDWVKAKIGTNEGWIRRGKALSGSEIQTLTQNPTEGIAHSGGGTALGGAGLLTGGASGIVNDAGDALDRHELKEVVGGEMQSRSDASSTSSDHKSGLDVAGGVAGSLHGLIGIATILKNWGERNTFFDRAMGGIEILESTVKTMSSANQLADGIAKAGGDSIGVGVANDSAYLESLSSGLSTIKDSFTGIVGLYRLYSSKSSTKTRDAAVSLQAIANAAKNAAVVAKSTYGILNQGIPTAVLNTIPALSIGVSAIHLITRLADAIESESAESMAGGEATTLMGSVVSQLNEEAPTEDTVDTSEVFAKEKRGVFPRYQIYFRVKKDLLRNFGEISAIYKSNSTPAENARQEYVSQKNSKKEKSSQIDTLNAENISADERLAELRAQREAVREDNSSKQSGRRGDAGNDAESLDFVISKLEEEKTSNSNKISEAQTGIVITDENIIQSKAEFDAQMTDVLAQNALFNNWSKIKEGGNVGQAIKTLDGAGSNLDSYLAQGKGDMTPFFKQVIDYVRTVNEYEFVDKMREINQKRGTTAWTDIVSDMISIVGDIVVLATGPTGLGAAIGMAMKTGTAGAKMAHTGAKFVQGVSRDKGVLGGNADKSHEVKHKEYVAHTKFIYNELALLADSSPGDERTARETQLNQYIKSTGVNVGMWSSIVNDPVSQAKMMIDAMKKR